MRPSPFTSMASRQISVVLRLPVYLYRVYVEVCVETAPFEKVASDRGTIACAVAPMVVEPLAANWLYATQS